MNGRDRELAYIAAAEELRLAVRFHLQNTREKRPTDELIVSRAVVVAAVLKMEEASL